MTLYTNVEDMPMPREAPPEAVPTEHQIKMELIDQLREAGTRIYASGRSVCASVSTYSLAPFCLLCSFSLSRNILLRILPLGDLGITSMNSTPAISTN